MCELYRRIGKKGDSDLRKIPKGKFSLDTQKEKRNHLLISTVTGVAPFVSYVRTLSKDWKEGRFRSAQDSQGKIFARHPEGEKKSSADFDRYWGGPVCQLCANFIEGLERRAIRRLSQTLPSEWRQPSVGVWI